MGATKRKRNWPRALVIGLSLYCVSSLLNAAVPEATADALRAKAVSQGKVRVIVQFADTSQFALGRGVSARQAQVQTIASLQRALVQRAAQPGLQEITRFRFIPFMTFFADAAALDTLARLPEIISIQEDIPEPPVLASSVPVIGAPAAWSAGYDGSGQVVAVLDTGVDTSHPFFPTGKLISEACFSANGNSGSASLCPGQASQSTATGSGSNCPMNVNGCDHGTHVAGIAVGNKGSGFYIGVAKEAGLIPIQVFTYFPAGPNCGTNPCALAYQSDQILGLEHVLDLSGSMDNIAAVNMSIGSNSTYSDQASCDADNAARKAAIDNLRAVGIATIIAAGNSSSRSGLSQPACISSAISVGNTTDADLVSNLSNVSGFLDLLAPGTYITSSVPGGGTASMSGTSMAAPHVAGAWAVLRQIIPQPGVDDILAALRATAESVDDQRSGGSVTDMRRINLDLALASLLPPAPEIETSPVVGSILDLGDISVGASGSLSDLQVSNTGDADLTLACAITGAQAGHFVLTQCPSPIVAATFDTISLRCDPLAIGDLSATLEVTTNDISEPLLNYSLECTGLGVEISPLPVSGTELDFSGVLTNTQSDELSVQVSNEGNQLLTLSCSLTGNDPAIFSITACPVSIAAAGQSPVSVRCEPTSVAAFSATLEITSNDTDEGLLSFPLACSGVVAEIDSDPVTGTSLGFGITVVGVESAGQFINLSNSGGGDLLLSCDLAGANPGSFNIINCPTSIAAGNQVDLELRCQPDATGVLAAQLQISSNDEDEPVLSFDLGCEGVAPSFEPDPVTGSSFDFGRVYLGEPGPVYQLTVTNSGTSALAVACDLTGAAAVDYAILLCPASVPSGQSELVQFECSPLTEGIKSAQLHLATDDTDDPEAVYELSCEAVVRPEIIFMDGYEDLPP